MSIHDIYTPNQVSKVLGNLSRITLPFWTVCCHKCVFVHCYIAIWDLLRGGPPFLLMLLRCGHPFTLDAFKVWGKPYVVLFISWHVSNCNIRIIYFPISLYPVVYQGGTSPRNNFVGMHFNHHFEILMTSYDL